MSDDLKKLRDLRKVAIDARDAYRKALEDAGEFPLRAAVERLKEMHSTHATELAATILEKGGEPDTGGSFMGLINRAIVGFRAMFGTLDRSALPGIVDGEKRILRRYYLAIGSLSDNSDERTMLQRHCGAIQREIAALRQESMQGESSTAT
jgi:uncharacterized protein (TIGR02284 family)